MTTDAPPPAGTPGDSAPRTRQTRQRIILEDYLAHTDQFHTAQEIHDQLRASGRDISLPTVYRALVALTRAGSLDALTTGGLTRYRRCSPEHHHHLVCHRCGLTIEVTGRPIEAWARDISRQYGFSHLTHVTEFTGLCARCTTSADATP